MKMEMSKSTHQQQKSDLSLESKPTQKVDLQSLPKPSAAILKSVSQFLKTVLKPSPSIQPEKGSLPVPEMRENLIQKIDIAELSTLKREPELSPESTPAQKLDLKSLPKPPEAVLKSVSQFLKSSLQTNPALQPETNSLPVERPKDVPKVYVVKAEQEIHIYEHQYPRSEFIEVVPRPVKEETLHIGPEKLAEFWANNVYGDQVGVISELDNGDVYARITIHEDEPLTFVLEKQVINLRGDGYKYLEYVGEDNSKLKLSLYGTETLEREREEAQEWGEALHEYLDRDQGFDIEPNEN